MIVSTCRNVLDELESAGGSDGRGGGDTSKLFLGRRKVFFFFVVCGFGVGGWWVFRSPGGSPCAALMFLFFLACQKIVREAQVVPIDFFGHLEGILR
jgi:hypothetical protein